MVESYGVLFKFDVDAAEGLQLVQENHAYIKKCVRKLTKKFDIFVSTGVTRTIKLPHSGTEKQYRLRIAPNADLIYSTKDPSFKGDWTTMGFVTVHFEPANTETKTKQQKNIPKEIGESTKTIEKLEEINNRLDKLEALLSPVNRTPVKKSTAKPAAVKMTAQALTTAPAKPTATPVNTPVKPPVTNQRPAIITKSPAKAVNTAAPMTATPVVTAKPSPAKVVNDTTPKAATPKKSAPLPVAGKSVNNVSAQSIAPQKPAPVKATPAKPAASKAKKPQTTKFLVPYNVSLGNNPTPLVNSTPHAPTRPQVDRDHESSASLKRPLDTSGDVVEAPLTKKKPRQEPTSDPGALVHLEEIIDAVAVGLDDPDDFAIESPFTQLTADEQSVVEENGQEETTVMNYQEFVETIPRKKKSKKHRRSKENEISSILE